jgi:hypothetical protein
MRNMVRNQWNVENKLDRSYSMERMPSASLGPLKLFICNLTMAFYQGVDFGLN